MSRTRYKTHRREALRVLATVGAGIGLSAVGSSARAASSSRYPVVQIGPIDAIGSAPLKFFYPDEASPCFCVALVEPAEHGVGPGGTIVAFSTLCPHMGCPIDRIDSVAGKLGPCRCHFSCFDIGRAGAQMQGHATEDLAQVVLEERDGVLYAVGMRGLVHGRLDNLE